MYVAVTAFLFEAFICRVQVELGCREEGTTFSVDFSGRDNFYLTIGQKACESYTVKGRIQESSCLDVFLFTRSA